MFVNAGRGIGFQPILRLHIGWKPMPRVRFAIAIMFCRHKMRNSLDFVVVHVSIHS